MLPVIADAAGVARYVTQLWIVVMSSIIRRRSSGLTSAASVIPIVLARMRSRSTSTGGSDIRVVALGAMALTVMPSVWSASANDLVSPVIPAFAEQYAGEFGTPNMPARDVTVIIVPDRRARIGAEAARMTPKCPFR